MSSPLVSYLFTLTLFSLIFNFAISIYGLFFRPHYVKKLIALTIFSDTLNAFAVYIGYRRWVNGVSPRPPVLVTEPAPSNLQEFVQRAVDPLPQALVLTAVVIGLAVTLFLVFLGYQLYKHYHTLDMRGIRRLKG
ncbi:MAG: sodium:proton antiporter [Desulfurococcus sp.]|nr:sodium:proton antiporter [Desulfurococcus sp.]